MSRPVAVAWALHSKVHPVHFGSGAGVSVCEGEDMCSSEQEGYSALSTSGCTPYLLSDLAG
jgi:hypothetical protein